MPEQSYAESIFGREEELAALAGFLDEIAAGPAALVLRGEPGVGKTTLWRAGLERAAALGYRVLSAVPLEFEAKLSFAVLGDLLQDVLEEVLPSLPGPQRRALEVALVRAEEEDGFVTDQRTISTAVLGAVKHLAEDRPVVIAVDDVQWVDPPSARVLQFVLHRLTREPVRLLATTRTGERPSDPLRLRRVLSEDRLHIRSLEGLGIRDVDRLLRTRLEAHFPRGVLTHLHQISGGNPFFAIEVGQALARRQGPISPYEPLPVPDDLLDLVADRLNSLPEAAKAPLLVVSALVQPTMSVVTSIVGVQGARQLRSAMDGGILEIEGETVRFAHPILASTFYSMASPAHRRGTHRAIAEVVSEPEERAIHLALSTAGPDAEVAEALEQAADRARSRGAQDAAAELLELSVRLSPRHLADDIRRRTVRAAQYHFEAGETSRGRALLEGIVRDTPAGPDRAEALRLLGTIRWYDSAADARSLFTQALDEAGSDESLRASVERELAWTVLLAGDAAGAEGHAQAALGLADRLKDPSLLADSLTVVAFCEATQGKGRPLKRTEVAAALAGRTEHVRLFRHPGLMHGILLKWADRFDEAAVQLEAMRLDALEHGDESTLPYVLYHQSELECWAGDWKQAEQHANESFELAVRTGQEQMRAGSLYVKALLDARFGRVDAARVEAEEGAALAEQTETPIRRMQNVHVLGFLELSLGNVKEAAEHLAHVDELALAMGLVAPGALRHLADEIEALVGLGDLDRARALLARLDEPGEALGGEWALAVADRCRGLILAADGHGDEAVVALERAFERHQKLSDPFELARTTMTMGTVRRRLKQKRPARDYLEQALQVFELLGASLWSDRARLELARISGRTAGSTELTPTERQVAEHVADGMSSKAVAEKLFLSVRTVDANLTRIYQKLSVKSRTEMAAKLREERPSDHAEAPPPP